MKYLCYCIVYLITFIKYVLLLHCLLDYLYKNYMFCYYIVYLITCIKYVVIAMPIFIPTTSSKDSFSYFKCIYKFHIHIYIYIYVKFLIINKRFRYAAKKIVTFLKSSAIITFIDG